MGRTKWRSTMHNFTKLAKEEVSRIEDALRKIDAFLKRAPEGCLKWQNKKGKTYYYHQFLCIKYYYFSLLKEYGLSFKAVPREVLGCSLICMFISAPFVSVSWVI